MASGAPDRQELRNFGLLTGALIALVFGLLLPWLHRWTAPRWPWVAGLALWVPALLWPMVLYPFYRVWTALGLGLGWVNSRIILSLLFFVVITPMGLLRRALGHDAVARRFEPQAASYRVASRARSKESMEKPF
ncbi:MAG TPA: SxtJ family membrane protein [Candidatus Binataceae bacterium]|nr:SxtJ family membrane protein [Candidatus Binataceae bacterium]